jgi:sugar phosphate isomerase/epimerase
MPVHIEYAAYNPSLATPEDLVSLVAHREYLYICLDVGHLRVSAEMLGRDEFEMARLLVPQTRSLHLWTLRDREDVRRYHHVPVHPSLTPAKGWLDIPAMLSLVFSEGHECAVVFEPHQAFNPDPDWQAEGIDWVRQIVRCLQDQTSQGAVVGNS